MLAFEGERLPRWVARRLEEAPAAGMTVFRHHNVRSPGQVRELVEAFQRAGRVDGGVATGGPPGGGAPAPMLVAADQEGGQLQGLGVGPTQFAGNMALGAVGDEDLAERVGRAIGLEARAMGINVVYAPVLDLASEPANTALGVRSFGDDPEPVARLGAAMVRGLQGAGVAATAKHFPGLGEVSQDTHHGLGVVTASRAELDAATLVPFQAAVGAGARLVMSAHIAAPALTDDPTLPATLSPAVMGGLLRDELGFAGVTISDALDMRALAQGAAQAKQIVAAIDSGVDLLLCSADRAALGRIEGALLDAGARGRFNEAALEAASGRIQSLRGWLGGVGPGPDLDVVGCADHQALSLELAKRSITLVRGWQGGPRDSAGSPRQTLPADATILAVMPAPTDLTPADTSGSVPPGLGRALRARFASVEEIVVGMTPTDGDVSALRERASAFDAVVVGTIDAIRQPAQFALVEAVGSAGRPTIAVALRTPWDAAGYPAHAMALCTYSILADSLDALASALAGDFVLAGRLPVTLPA